MARIYTHLDEAVSYLINEVQGDFKVAVPLGLGKPNQLINLIYDKFKTQLAQRRLEIYSALSLDIPATSTSVEKNLLTPFFDRHFGPDYPRLQYVQDLKANKVPTNIDIYEFYFLAGQYANVRKAQQNYISLNYTHAAKSIANRGLKVAMQMVSKKIVDGKAMYSLSCNPDVLLDLVDLFKSEKKKLVVVGVVHPDLPFLGGDALVTEEFFDVIVESPEVKHQLFALPKNSVDPVDHMIGFHASRLLPDDGTLQIGIGSLSDAVVHSLLVRHQKNNIYCELNKKFWSQKQAPNDLTYYENIFTKGIYGTSEMLMDGFMHLRKAGILRRYIFDQDENKRRYLHGAFFLGTKDLYHWLRNLSEEDFAGLSMTRVSKVNDLYDEHEMALRRQRKNARFFNTCMQVSLLGEVSSDTLANGQVVSGVGGQYNFVAMSQELADAHSVIMLRSTRTKNGKRISNIVANAARLTVSRHLRDVIVTEYGVASLRGKSDSEVIAALIEISDSEFQQELIDWAQANQKLSEAYVLPAWAKNNTPVAIEAFVKEAQKQNVFIENPFGSDFTEIENKIIKALGPIKDHNKFYAIKLILKGFMTSAKNYEAELERLKLKEPANFKDKIAQALVIGALSQSN